MERDLIWHTGESEHGDGSAQERNLSYDEEGGFASLKVRFTTDWSSAGRRPPADAEWYVLPCQVTVGGTVLGPQGF
ncbi:hypothetical protein ACFWUW_29110 [Streptomyces sp. NPDC058655]|uniref:hypothetical protein n=1 Tax=Streptomyces sp. NPDC058655 TaxID=3346577 RepID=UPI00364720D9